MVNHNAPEMTMDRNARILKAQASRSAGGFGARSVAEATWYVDTIDRALDLHAAGWSLFRIAADLGVTKEWLRTRVGLA